MANPGGPSAIPSFVCVLPCTKPPVKYLDLLDGCADGIHVTREDIQNLQSSLYDKMADAIKAHEDQGATTTSPDPCSVCKDPIVPRHNSPVFHMENCDHYFHFGCIPTRSSTRKCPECQVVSSRVLLWPERLPNATAKNEIFQLQKLSLGLDVAPQTVLQVDYCTVAIGFPAFKLTVNAKILKVGKRPPANVGYGFGFCSAPGHRRRSRDELVAHFDEMRRRKRLLLQFRCPMQCTRVQGCPFSHGNSNLSLNQANLRHFPSFFCVHNSVNGQSWSCCRSVRLRANYQELTRCSAGFHPTLHDLENVDGFASKMAKQIMARAVEPEPSTLVCSYCKEAQAVPPNPVRMYLQNCPHWIHVHCLPKARLEHCSTKPNRKLDLICPTCSAASVRTLAWPGSFRSSLLKCFIFGRQLSEFWLAVQEDTQLKIVQVANRVNTFTLDYGGPSVVTIDAETAKRDIYYD